MHRNRQSARNYSIEKHLPARVGSGTTHANEMVPDTSSGPVLAPEGQHFT
jgi:hypothetical protein